MSILQDYEQIRRELGEEIFRAIEEYLQERPELYLSDIYYKRSVWDEFEEWYKGRKMRE